MTPKTPKVTVGMAVYRGEDHIAETISSVLAQEFSDWELLVINDCSPDDSVGVVQGFEDKRIRLLHNANNEGLVAVRNQILSEARGEYVAWLDQDDLATPKRLSTQVKFLDAHPYVAACGSITNTLTQTLGAQDLVSTNLLPLTHREIRATIPFLNPMACNTVTMRQADFKRIGLFFRPEFGNSLDYDLWSLASDQLQLVNLRTPLGTYRVHAGQTSQGAALDLMNDYALRVQLEIIERTLGIRMSEHQLLVHRSATIAPLLIPNVEHLREIAAWFALLQEANRHERAFDKGFFDQALTRQWTTVVLSARAQVPGKDLALAVADGLRTFRPGVLPAVASIFHGVRRRRATRPAPLRAR